MYSHSQCSSAAPPLFTAQFILTKLCAMDERERPITKRQLGIALAVIGVLGFLAILAIDVLDVGRQGGIGPAQSLALLVAAVTAIIGLTLIPLGDAPA